MIALFAYFALIDANNVVENVIVADSEFVAKQPGEWVEVKKDRPGTHASRGDHYDRSLKLFHRPKPFDSWVLNKETMEWDPPTSVGRERDDFGWDEESKSWKARNEIRRFQKRAKEHK